MNSVIPSSEGSANRPPGVDLERPVTRYGSKAMPGNDPEAQWLTAQREALDSRFKRLLGMEEKREAPPPPLPYSTLSLM